MNRMELERKLLLAQSGELAPAEKAELDEIIANDNSGAALRDELDNLLAQGHRVLPAEEPSPQIVSRIMDAANRTSGHNRVVFHRPTVRLMACAAALAIAVTGWFTLLQDEEQPDQVGQLHVLVAMVSEEDVQEDTTAGDMEEERIRELARQLLMMEGFGDEDIVTEELLLMDPAPTTLQLRNTSEIHQRICV